MTLTEFKERRNTHQTHTEDLVLLGEDGIAELNDKVEKIMRMLRDNQREANITQKVDGAPAVQMLSHVNGYPDNCIGLKSLINDPKNALKSEEEIDAKYGDRLDMAAKLRACLELAHCIPEGEIWQGDCLFSADDLAEQNINGKNYITFQPNKIVYAVSSDSPAYKTIRDSSFGICLHTRYINGKQRFDINLDNLIGVPNDFYVTSPEINTDNANINIGDLSNSYYRLQEAEKELLAEPGYEDLCNNTYFMSYWNTFENANLSDKARTKLDPATFQLELHDYILAKQEKEYLKKMNTLKSEEGKERATVKYNADLEEMANILNTNQQLLDKLVATLNAAVDVKMILWEGLKNIESDYDTYYRHRERGFIPAEIEGISVSDMDGNIVKIVDRSKFSNANRDPNYLSGFEHESLGESLENRIDIRVYISPNLDEVLPTGNIEDQYDEQTLEEWYDFAATVEGIIEKNCHLVNINLSKRPDSLSEYIDFYTISKSGEKVHGLVDLRLSDHPQTRNGRELRKHRASKLDPDYRLKSVTVNDHTFESYDEAIKYIRNMFNIEDHFSEVFR